MVYAAFAYVNSGGSIVRPCGSLLDKISNVSLKNGVGDGGLSQRKPFLPSFWLLMDGLSLII
jgi:hypothetical protein